jgi:hypothetical protein
MVVIVGEEDPQALSCMNNRVLLTKLNLPHPFPKSFWTLFLAILGFELRAPPALVLICDFTTYL